MFRLFQLVFKIYHLLTEVPFHRPIKVKIFLIVRIQKNPQKKSEKNKEIQRGDDLLSLRYTTFKKNGNHRFNTVNFNILYYD